MKSRGILIANAVEGAITMERAIKKRGRNKGTGTSCKENFQTGFVVAEGRFRSY